MRPQVHPFAVVLAAFLVGLSNPTLGAVSLIFSMAKPFKGVRRK